MAQLVELILYGIRPFQTMTRITFGPGFNLVTGGVGTGKSTICEMVVALLFPGTAAQFRPFPHLHHPERAQAVLTFQGDDGARYRLARDFVKLRVTLAKLDPQAQGAATATPIATPIATDDPSVETAISGLLHGITADELRQRWLLLHTQLPSALGHSMNGASAVASPSPAGSARPATASSAAGSRQAGSRLEELKQALARAEEVSTLDEKVMAAQDRVGAFKQKLARFAQLIEEQQELQGELKTFAGFDKLPSDYPVLVEGLVERERALHAQLYKVEEQQTELEEERAGFVTEPIFRQRLFQVGAGLTGLALLVALFVTLPGQLKLIFPFLLAAGLGILSWAIFTDMKTQGQRSGLDQKAKSLRIEREATEKRFARDQRLALDLLAQTHCQDVPTFQERARGYQRLKENIENLDQEQTHYLAGQTKEQLEQQQRQAVEECKKLEEQMRTLASAPGGVGDIPSLHAEISRLESAGSQGTTGGPDAERGPARAVAVTPSTNHSWIEALRARWPSDDTALQAAISALFAKLSGGHYAKVEWGDNGLRIYSATQQLIDPELLSSGQRDLLALACFLAPWGSSRAGKGKSPASRFPLLLDEPFLSLDGAGQSACLQLLRALAPAQQVILATRLPVAEEAADHRIALPLAPQAAEATNR